MKLQGKSIAIGLIIGFVIGLLIPFNPLQFFSEPTHMKVTVLEGHPEKVKIAGRDYTFAYSTEYLGLPVPSKLVVATETAFKTFDPIEGANYKAYGLEIVVSEVHADKLVLQVKAET